MAVSSLLTSLENHDGSPTYVSNNTRYGGGQGASTNTDIFIQGTQSSARRADNVTDYGFGLSLSSTDLSGAGEHVKFWVFVTQWASATQLSAVIASGSTGATGDIHDLPTGEFPDLGGFIPLWVDVSRTATTGGPANEAAINEIGVRIDIGDVGGNAQNLIMDEIHHGTSGLQWTGTGPGTLSDFRTYENNNNIGVLVTNNGVDFCFARIEIGNSGGTESDFDDSGFTIVFPDQSLVADTFMGLTFEMHNASSVMALANATIQSSDVVGATKRPDIIVNGTSGSLTFTTVNILGMRTVDFTSAVDYDGGIMETANLTQASAEIQNATIRPNTASAVAMCDDPTFGTSGVHDCSIVQAGLGHAFEITSTGSVDFDNLTFTGFGADGENDAAIFNDSGGAVTINVLNGGDTPTVRNGTGASTTINNAVTVTTTVKDANDLSNIQNARVYLQVDDFGDLPFEETVTITRSATTATVTHTGHGLATNDEVKIQGADQEEYNGVKTITVTGTDTYTYTVSGSPTTPATGTIDSTFVVLNGLTNASGVVEDTGFNFTSNQPVTGRVRRGTSATYYKTSAISGTITNAGFNSTILLIQDG
ncbi:MAG: hypothetical protein DWQ49_09565 [Bacteroidetes bacterium]|nr:MAG: hypothetical protein DWQ49_09565 [Bacteroidota bacterium]